MIRSFKIRHFKHGVLGSVGGTCLEGNWQNHLTKGWRRVPWDDPVERGLHRGEHIGDVQAHLRQSTQKENVESAPAVDEYFGELGAHHPRIQDEWEYSWLREVGPLITFGEGDGDFKPSQEPGSGLFDCHDLT